MATKEKPKPEIMLAISKAHAAILVAVAVADDILADPMKAQEKIKRALDEADKALAAADRALAERRREIIASAERL